jgi:uncharacterized membrane protein YqhA
VVFTNELVVFVSLFHADSVFPSLNDYKWLVIVTYKNLNDNSDTIIVSFLSLVDLSLASSLSFMN